MKIAVLLNRHKRLLALCGLSACVHLLALELAARRAAMSQQAPPAGEALRLHLRPAQRTAPKLAAGERFEAPPPPRRAAATPAKAVPSAAVEVPQQAAVSSRSAAPTAVPPAADVPSVDAGTPLVQMPGRYRVRLPDPVRLGYTVVVETPGSPPQPGPDASLDWRSDGQRYVLAVDGVLGRLRSEGASGDAGIVPRMATDDRQQTRLVTEFDPDGGRILFHPSGASVPDAVGVQDPASLLMQLAGIGLADPDQIRSQLNGEIRIVVAQADGAAIARFQVMGKENLATAVGDIEAWRLDQIVPAGQDRTEFWLAPARGWLPVRIRLVHADGRSATQTLARIEAGAAR